MTQNEFLKIHIDILEVLKRTCQQIKVNEDRINECKVFEETCRRYKDMKNEKIYYGWACHIEGEKRAQEYLIQVIGDIFVKNNILLSVTENSIEASLASMKMFLKGDNKK